MFELSSGQSPEMSESPNRGLFFRDLISLTEGLNDSLREEVGKTLREIYYEIYDIVVDVWVIKQ